MRKVNLYIETSTTAFQKKERACGYVLEYITPKGQTVTREGFQKEEGTYHQEVLRTIGTALGRIREPCQITIFSRDSFVLNMISSSLPKWAEDDFKSKGKPIVNQEEWRSVWEGIREHKVSICIGEHAYTKWMLAEMEERSAKEKKEGKEHPAGPGH